MQELEGQRKGSVLYLHNDYLYRKDKERNDFFSSHNHGMEDIGVLQLKTELKKAAYEIDARLSAKTVFDNWHFVL